ncbi:MAG: flagellar motor switch protein FliM [Alphaproteobacteria bacterium]
MEYTTGRTPLSMPNTLSDVLNHEDVTKLTEKENQHKKIAAILEGRKIHSERLPILDVVFDRLVRLLTTSLRNFTSDNVDVSCARVTSVRFSDYLNAIPLPSLIGVFKAKQWDTPALITIDSQLVYSIVDVLLGGRKSTHTTSRAEGRPYTTLERNLIERLIAVILTDLTEAFSPICAVDFQYERLETNPRFAAVVHEKNVTMKFVFKLEMEDRSGHFDIVIPYSSVEPIRDLLIQNFMGEKFGCDQIWEDHLADRIREAEVSLEAALPTEVFSLKDVLSWKKGSQIVLSSDMQSPIHLRSQNHQLLLGKLGQKNGHVAVKVDDILFGKNGEI